MPRVRRDFEKEEAKLRKGLDGNDRQTAVGGLQVLEEEWARALVGAKPGGTIRTAMKAAAGPKLDPSLALEAAKHLANAEKWAWDYASYATSGAEGMTAMGEVRTLRVAHAWMLVAAATNAKSRARELYQKLQRDRENFDSFERRELDKIKACLK
jgi:hypothetical protein